MITVKSDKYKKGKCIITIKNHEYKKKKNV